MKPKSGLHGNCFLHYSTQQSDWARENLRKLFSSLFCSSPFLVSGYTPTLPGQWQLFPFLTLLTFLAPYCCISENEASERNRLCAAPQLPSLVSTPSFPC